MHDIIAYVIKHVPVIQWLYSHIISAFFSFLGLFTKTNDKLILFVSYGGDRFDDSPKVLFEAMKKNARFDGYQFAWAFGKPDLFDIQGAEKVKIDTLSYFLTAIKAKIWITNVNIERGLHFKKKDTLYLNTWHGTGPKKSGNAIKGRNDYDFSYVDIICVDGNYSRDVMVNAFNAKDKSFLYCGRPREDALFLFTELDTVRVRKKLKIPDEKKVLLYMPTWREYGNLQLNYELWDKELSKDYVLLIRFHHFAKKGKQVPNAGFCIDVSDYSDVNDLYWISDVLISDYSSAFFDFGLLGKPMVCFAYDYDRVEKTVGFFMDLKNEFPSGIKQTEEETIAFIKNMDYYTESKRCRAYIEGYVLPRTGSATNACLARLCELL